MFHYVMNVRHRTRKDVFYGVFGKEESLEMTKYAFAYGGHYTKEQLAALVEKEKKVISADVTNVGGRVALDETELTKLAKNKFTSDNVLVYRKLFNPLKWLEAGFALLFWWLDELCLPKTPAAETSNSSTASTTTSNISVPGKAQELGFKDRRFWCRLLVYCTFGLAEGLIKYFTSPYNQILKPIKRAWEGKDEKRAELWAGVAILMAALVIYCVVCTFTGGAAFLPALVALLGSMVQGLIGVLGGSLLATIGANALVTFLALIIPQIIVQKFFNGLNILADSLDVMGGFSVPAALGGDGFEPKEAYVKTALHRSPNFARGAEQEFLSSENLADPNSRVARSTYIQFLLFNSFFKVEDEEEDESIHQSIRRVSQSVQHARLTVAGASNTRSAKVSGASPSAAPHSATFPPPSAAAVENKATEPTAPNSSSSAVTADGLASQTGDVTADSTSSSASPSSTSIKVI